MTYDELVDRTVRIIGELSDLKDDVSWSQFGAQADFDTGMLAAALTIIEANIDEEDPRVKVEYQRQTHRRLMHAMTVTDPRDCGAEA